MVTDTDGNHGDMSAMLLTICSLQSLYTNLFVLLLFYIICVALVCGFIRRANSDKWTNVKSKVRKALLLNVVVMRHVPIYKARYV